MATFDLLYTNTCFVEYLLIFEKNYIGKAMNLNVKIENLRLIDCIC